MKQIGSFTLKKSILTPFRRIEKTMLHLNKNLIFSLPILSSTFLLAIAGLAPGAQPPAPDAQTQFAAKIQPVLLQYCGKCHTGKEAQAGVDLANYKTVVDLQKDQKTWRKMLSRISDRSMPPAGLPALKTDEHTQMVTWLKKTLDSADASLLPANPGRVLIHRLNRQEYNNTVRDLLGVNTLPADSFPADGGGGGGFDNNADTLFMPPILMERYLDAATNLLAQTKPERLFPFKPVGGASGRAVAQKNLVRFATLAYRRPVEAGEISRLLSLYDLSRKGGASHEEASKQAMKAVMISPSFLFRIEKDAVGAKTNPQLASGKPVSRTLNDYELASRLSYFLWSSMPDEELFRLAGIGRLRVPEVLSAQVARMLRSPKSSAFTESFASQWLKVRDLYTSAKPDPGRFPDFTPTLRDAMYRETTSYFDSVIREDKSLLALLDSDYTFVNEELAKRYGIPGVKGTEMRRVKLADRTRGGVLTMASVLTLTSFPLRTSPVLRGKWIMEQVLGTPPPPPPPVVATLSTDDTAKDGLSFRQRLELHRKKPECAGCHAKMDPLGFGLENFDGTGRWRDLIGGAKVDSSGVLTTGEKFSGPAELKTRLLAQKEDFVRNLTEKMLAYSLGRGVEPYDIPTVRKITASVLKNDCKSDVLIQEIAKSYPFTNRQ